MSAKLTLKIEKNIVIDATDSCFYVVNVTAEASEEIPRHVFVYSCETQLYNRIASYYDLVNYPESLNEAVNVHADYFRLPNVQKRFRTVDAAKEFEQFVTGALRWLVANTSTGNAGWATETIVNIGG